MGGVRGDGVGVVTLADRARGRRDARPELAGMDCYDHGGATARDATEAALHRVDRDVVVATRDPFRRWSEYGRVYTRTAYATKRATGRDDACGVATRAALGSAWRGGGS